MYKQLFARLTLLLAAALSIGLATPLQASAGTTEPAQAQPKVTNCVLLEGGGATCGENMVMAGALAVVVAQHPDYEGEVLNLHLPDGQPRCSDAYDTEYWIELENFWENRISSLYTRKYCDAKLFDGDNLTGTQTGWYDHCKRLSLISGTCVMPEGSLFAFDNRAQSLRVS